MKVFTNSFAILAAAIFSFANLSLAQSPESSELNTPATRTILSFYNAFAVGDINTVEKLLDDTIVWNQPGNSSLSGQYKGKAEVLGLFGEFGKRSGNTLKLEVLQVMLKANMVAVTVQYAAERKEKKISGFGIDVFKVKDGKVIEGTLFTDDQNKEDVFWDL